MSAPFIDELEAIRTKAQDGLLRAKDVVDFARSNPDSKLHAHFEWDDSVAAEEFRLHQARGLIRAVITFQPATDGTPVRTRAYISLPSERVNGGGYRRIEQAQENPAMVGELIGEFKASLAGLHERFAQFRSIRFIRDVMNVIGAAGGFEE